jgi:glutaredoxin
LAAGRRGNPMPRLTLYTKPDCSLCDAAAAALARVRERVAFDLEVVDISPDPELRASYGERIPVVLVDGELVFEYEVDERALEHRLSATGALS